MEFPNFENQVRMYSPDTRTSSSNADLALSDDAVSLPMAMFTGTHNGQMTAFFLGNSDVPSGAAQSVTTTRSCAGARLRPIGNGYKACDAPTYRKKKNGS